MESHLKSQAYLEQILCKSCFPCVHQSQSLIEVPDGLIRNIRKSDLDFQGQLGRGVAYFDPRAESTYLVLPSSSSGQHLLQMKYLRKWSLSVNAAAMATVLGYNLLHG